ncbi:TetR/AcrR family transcriptional regulator [Paenibacillus sp. DXFW5]|uniref:TetR/AcrR family transcriptional regulator n=1 Tax=Paenibacillus rhizolycopersici TaxID=2780073 RepID=A0ABS2H8E0_9BACL|nr:TetR/AcrR family transcriptional regulator [Paenibacillus rhizolycopersici]MBM6996081.1 TetR/AcrR family transcriptional regulator [Paenibacillus rhizolycopersici]
MSTNPEEKVDPRVTRTKRLFREALIALLQESADPHKVTVQSLASRAGLNRATFYLHYRDVEDLLEQLTREVLDELARRMRPLTESGPSREQSPLVSFLEQIYENAALFQVLMENKEFRHRLFAMLTDIVSIRRERRKLADPAKQVPIQIVAASSLGIVSWWIEEGTPYSPSYLADQINQMYRRK